MAAPSQFTAAGSFRRLRPIPWCHDGCDGLVVRARGDIPTCDESMIRIVLRRAASSCQQIAALDRAFGTAAGDLIPWAARSVGDLEKPAGLKKASRG